MTSHDIVVTIFVSLFIILSVAFHLYSKKNIKDN